MTRQEFENRIGKTRKPTEEEYKLIEYIYTFHPAISETKGKDQVAWIYMNLGMSVFRDMEKKAKQMEELEAEFRSYQTKLNRTKELIEKLKKGDKELWEI